MSDRSGTKVLLHILNSILVILALAIIAGSLWFFVQVVEFTNLRNSNHYLLDYNVYWPQAVPWMFILVSVFVICVCGCGFSGSKKSNKGLLTVYTICSGVAIIALVATAIIALVFADNKSTDDFVKDTVWDVYFQAKTDRDVANAFGVIERKLHCCGADSPRDYKNWKNEFPMACCDTYYHGWLEPYTIECEFTNKLANERHGCSTVAAQYARIAIKVLSGASIFTAFILIISLIVAATMAKGLKRTIHHHVHESTLEIDSKKGLL